MIRRPAYTIWAAAVLCITPMHSAPAAFAQSTGPVTEPVFREAAAETGLDFHHFTGSTGDFYLAEIMGPGVALFDYDNDGDLDVYFLQGNLLNTDKTLKDATFPPPKAHWPGNRLFRNEIIPSGKLRFTDVTEKAGVEGNGYGLGAATGDYDNDGDTDLFVTNFGGSILYRNNGGGTFSDVTREAGVGGDGFRTSSSFLDYDRDGRLDLYVARYNAFHPGDNKRCKSPSGARDYCGPTSYFPIPDRLYHNEGGGKFRDVTAEAGIAKAPAAAGLGVAGADFNGDGWIDIYVANDQTPNHLWINRKDGTFEEFGLISGTAFNENGEVEASMGVAVGDFDGDGDEDIFLTHLGDQTNTLYLNDGSANFDDSTSRFGLDAPSLMATGFGTTWFDYDNDGRLDLFSANGSIMMSESLRGNPFPYHERNQLFHNEGRRFRDVSAGAGPAMQLSDVSRGAAFGDIDNDGDIDIVVGNCNGPARLMLNELGGQNGWIEVQLDPTEGNRSGYGAHVGLLRKGRPPVWRRVATDGSYLSANDPRAHFGLGSEAGLAAAPIEALTVIWSNGGKERFSQVKPRSLARLKQGTGTPER